MRAKKGQERTVPWIEFQHSHPAAGVCCLFRPTKYRYRSIVLYTVYVLLPARLIASTATDAIAKKKPAANAKIKGILWGSCCRSDLVSDGCFVFRFT